MPDPTPFLSSPVHRRSAKALVFALLTAVAIFFQWNEGAYRSEFGGHPDEAAHYVTGLLVGDTLAFAKDYALSGFAGSPVAKGKEFVQSFYDHYPKVGLGLWPPLFYVTQSVWELPFGSSRTSVLLLIACLAGGVGTLLYSAIAEEFGAGFALAGSLIWLGLPPVQQYSGMVMAETLSTLAMFGATLRLGRYLDERRPKDAIAFGLFTAAALCTKGTGLALALVGLFSVLLTRRFSILKEGALWIAGLIAVLLGGPCVVASSILGKGGWEEAHPSWHFTSQALPYYGWKLVVALGFLLTALAILGCINRARTGFVPSADNPKAGKWASCLALIAAVVIFQSIAPAGKEVRHLIPALPAAMMLAIAGAAWIAQRCSAPQLRAAFPSLTVLVFLTGSLINPASDHVFFGSVGDKLHLSPFKVRQKDCTGFGPVAAHLMERNPIGKFLVSSDATGEGMFIAEVAMADPHRPGCSAKRASKELAQSAWSGSGYSPKYTTDEALLAYLTGSGFDSIVIDPALPERNRRPHHEMLARVLRAHPERFKLWFSQPIFRSGEQMASPLEVYYPVHPVTL